MYMPFMTGRTVCLDYVNIALIMFTIDNTHLNY